MTVISAKTVGGVGDAGLIGANGGDIFAGQPVQHFVLGGTARQQFHLQFAGAALLLGLQGKRIVHISGGRQHVHRNSRVGANAGGVGAVMPQLRGQRIHRFCGAFHLAGVRRIRGEFGACIGVNFAVFVADWRHANRLPGGFGVVKDNRAAVVIQGEMHARFGVKRREQTCVGVDTIAGQCRDVARNPRTRANIGDGIYSIIPGGNVGDADFHRVAVGDVEHNSDGFAQVRQPPSVSVAGRSGAVAQRQRRRASQVAGFRPHQPESAQGSVINRHG